jgi:Flp pilus assembly pilin Flp
MMTVKRLFLRLLRQTGGQDLVEYALLSGCIAALSLAGVTSVGQSLTGLNTSVANGIVSQGQAAAALPTSRPH